MSWPVDYPNILSRAFVGRTFQRQFVIPLEAPPVWLERFLQWYERYALHVDTRGIDIDRPIFLVGLPRSGTTMVQDILCAHPQVAYITNTMHQFRTCFCAAEDLRKRLHLDARGERFVRDGVDVTLGSANEGHAFLADWRRIDPYSLEFVPFSPGDLSTAEKEQVRNAVRRMIWCFGAGPRRFFNKNPALLPYLQLVVDLFPDARVVHLVRDARMCANSLVKLFRRHREQEARVRAELHTRSSNGAWFVPYPRLPRLVEYITTYGPEDVRTTAHVWNDAIDCVNEARGRLPALYEVRYEDIVSDPKHEILKLLQFCQLEPPSEQATTFWQKIGEIEDRAHTHAYGDFELIEEICRTNLRRYCYV
jgi:hypothetical protein